MMASTTQNTPLHPNISHHHPVMVDQVIDIIFNQAGIHQQSQPIVIDGTVGGGGHTRAILEHLPREAQIYCFDRDPNAIELARTCIQNDSRATFIQESYSRLDRHVAAETVSAVLLDLGLSTDQLDSERGFAFSTETPLDMRFDPSSELTAYSIVNQYSIDRMRQLFFKYGEEPLAPRIARRIAEIRKEGALRTTIDLLEAIGSAVPDRFKNKAAARIFQALRIEVNQEIEHYERGLEVGWNALRTGGVLCVIGYHSIEDRRMKRFVAERVKGCTCPPKFPVCACGKKPTAKNLTSSALRPTAKEMRLNPKSRSARLRAAVKISLD